MISITDHDYIENYSDLASKYDISTVTGIEFNTSYKKMHILGYGIEDIQLVKKIMNELAMYNEDVVLKVIQMLERDGFNISRSKIIVFCKENNMKHEFLDKKILVKYLINKGYCNSVKEGYDNLIGRNAPYYYAIHKLSPKEVINLIDNTGGISVWAHPDSINILDNTFLDTLMCYGLMGIELSKKRTEIERKQHELIALKNNLIKTYGSDFHNQNDEMGIEIEKEKCKTLIKQIGGKIC